MDIEQELGLSLARVGLVEAEDALSHRAELEELMRKYPAGSLRWTEPNDVFEMIEDGELQVWFGVDCGKIDGAMLTWIERHRYRCILNILWIGGRGVEKYLRDGLRKLELFAKDNNISEIVVTGRRGWLRRLAPFGYVLGQIQLRKDVRSLWRN